MDNEELLSLWEEEKLQGDMYDQSEEVFSGEANTVDNPIEKVISKFNIGIWDKI